MISLLILLSRHATRTQGDTWQWVIVICVLAACVITVIWKIIRNARRKGPACNCGCSSCPAAKHCTDPVKNQHLK